MSEEFKTRFGKEYDGIIFIGRFQPVHNAHIEIIKKAYQIAEKVVIVIGSANQPRTLKNPWTAKERQAMIELALDEAEGIPSPYHNPHVEFVYNVDTMYNDQAWATRIQEIANKHIKSSARNADSRQPRIGIIGHKKQGDDSTFYLDMFPQWGFVDMEHNEAIDATQIRELYFSNQSISFLRGVVSDGVYKFLNRWKDRQEYEDIYNEKIFVEKYKEQYAGLKYDPTHNTADAVVIQSGHILLVKRKAYPGKGLWALPGGFLNAKKDRSLRDCALRELREETGLKVPGPVLAGSIKESKTFDAIDRSSRGRTITQAFYIVLPNGPLPKVKGQDDAEKAEWVPLGNIDSSVMFEDHHDIINYFVGVE